MYQYKATNPENGHVLQQTFPTKLEAKEFAEDNKFDFPKYSIDFVNIDGIIIEEPESDELEYDEDAELNMMGLDEEETSQGFDWTLEDKSGDD